MIRAIRGLLLGIAHQPIALTNHCQDTHCRSAEHPRVSFAQLIKNYSASQEETRYSPAKITGIEIVERFGQPDPKKISTSYSERVNLSFRMHVRRFTRITNAHSKTYRHHSAMTSIFVAWYIFCRRHQTLRGMTPAMAAGLTDHVKPRGPRLRCNVFGRVVSVDGVADEAPTDAR